MKPYYLSVALLGLLVSLAGDCRAAAAFSQILPGEPDRQLRYGSKFVVLTHDLSDGKKEYTVIVGYTEQYEAQRLGGILEIRDDHGLIARCDVPWEKMDPV